MNHVLIITYELKGTGPYASLYEAIKTLGTWWHYLPSTWIVVSTRTPAEAWVLLKPHIQEKPDFMFIGTLQSGYSGWLPKDAWEWLKTNGGIIP